MGGRRKRERIAETKVMDNILEYPSDIAGQWHTFFGWQADLTLELGCGKGEYTLAMARLYPHQQFIGLDIKGDRMWVGAKQAINEGLKNAAFLRIPIESLAEYFEKGEVQNIWITFPDPFPKPSKAKRRMISSRFLQKYEQILKPGGRVHLKTDNFDYFRFGLDTIEEEGNWICCAYTLDLYSSNLQDELTNIQTYYEGLWLQDGKQIKYGVFQFRPEA